LSTPLKYLLRLDIKGYRECDWAAVGDLAARLPSRHSGAGVALVSRWCRIVKRLVEL
jgi:hypothetical protein